MSKSVVTLGTFDGVHRGHQKILQKVVSRAKAIGGRSIALAFGMPPRLGHNPAPNPVLLSNIADKTLLLKRCGIDQVQILTFSPALANTSPEDFFYKRILKRCGAKEMVVGPRVSFGKNRAGRLPLLKRLGERHAVRIHVVNGVTVGRKAVSSSAIRQALFEGNIDRARRQLGYPYSVAGRVVHGDHRGRKLGYPTANVAIDQHQILPPGVFWVKCLLGDRAVPFDSNDLSRALDGLCNVGTRPTFHPKERKLTCEVFLFKTPPPLYGKRIRVVFMRRIRSEKRFQSAQHLQRQIERDFTRAKRWAR
jgi:riboflavin kinase / FMN adenylyltransferase